MSVLLLGAALLFTQAHPQPADTLRLADLQRAAVALDPRFQQLALHDSAAALRIRNIEVDRLPAVSLAADATHQSDVVSLPLQQAGFAVPKPPASNYEAALEVEQRLYDGGVGRRREAAEMARLRSERARIASVLHPLREEVNRAFFEAVLQQHRVEEVMLSLDDLQARVDQVREQVQAGAALPGDTAEIHIAILRARQEQAHAASQRSAALTVLSRLTGVELADASELMLPEISTLPASADGGLLSGSSPHPQYALFDAERGRLEQLAGVASAALRPRVAAFGRWAFGSPGPRQFEDAPYDYWMAGVRVEWQPWNWSTTRRERALLTVEGEMLRTEREAFTADLLRRIEQDRAAIIRLRDSIAMDDEIVALREQLDRQAAAQWLEQEITTADYVRIRAELQTARLARSRHQVELAHACARYLTALGYEVP